MKPEDDVEYWIAMAYSLGRQGKSDKAQKYYEKALEVDPENVTALNNLANCLSEQGKEEEALKYLKYTTQVHPDYVEGWINLGLSYEENDDLDEAMKCFNTAKDLDPGNAALWHNRGNALRRQKKFKDAISNYDTSLRLRPLHIDTIYDKAYAHLSISEMNDARIGSGIDDKYNLKMIQTRKEYLESILNDFGSGQISPEKLVGELTQEIKYLYSFTETLVTNVA